MNRLTKEEYRFKYATYEHMKRIFDGVIQSQDDVSHLSTKDVKKLRNFLYGFCEHFGFEDEFLPVYGDYERVGQSFKVLRRGLNFGRDTGYKWLVQFEDGEVMEVYGEEISRLDREDMIKALIMANGDEDELCKNIPKSVIKYACDEYEAYCRNREIV